MLPINVFLYLPINQLSVWSYLLDFICILFSIDCILGNRLSSLLCLSTDQCYLNVKQSLHTSTPIHVVGRGVEESDVTEFLKGHLDKCSAGSLYISGAPGTGKTAAILHIIDDLKVMLYCGFCCAQRFLNYLTNFGALNITQVLFFMEICMALFFYVDWIRFLDICAMTHYFVLL